MGVNRKMWKVVEEEVLWNHTWPRWSTNHAGSWRKLDSGIDFITLKYLRLYILHLIKTVG